MTSGPDPGELPGFWGSMVFRHAPIPRKGSGNQQQQQEYVVHETTSIQAWFRFVFTAGTMHFNILRAVQANRENCSHGLR